jgi:hypothetical protein
VLLEETLEQALGEGGHLALVDRRALELKDLGLVRDDNDEYYDEAEHDDEDADDEAEKSTDDEAEGSTDDDGDDEESESD